MLLFSIVLKRSQYLPWYFPVSRAWKKIYCFPQAESVNIPHQYLHHYPTITAEVLSKVTMMQSANWAQHNGFIKQGYQLQFVLYFLRQISALACAGSECNLQ